MERKLGVIKLELEFERMIKDIIKRIIVVVSGKNIAKIHLKDSYKVISFDLFDTLIFRKVGKPENVFYEVEREYKRISGDADYDGSIRIRAERDARRNAHGQEVSLEDIYTNINRSEVQDIDLIKKIEVETEIDTCEPNEEIADFYRRLVNEGKRIIIVTDMYLEKPVIEKILEKCNLGGYDRLFISSEAGVSKRHGELFNYVLSELSIKPDEIVHIGDNPIGDYLIPKAKGWNTFLYRKN